MRSSPRSYRARTLLPIMAVIATVTSPAPAPASAQSTVTPELRLGPVILGESPRDVVEAFIGEPLTCGDPVGLHETPEETAVVGCESTDPASLRLPEAVFVHGRLVHLRYIPVYDGPVDRILETLRSHWRVAPTMETGEADSVRGLRFWVFEVGDSHAIVSEVRMRDTREMRIRITLSLDPDLWYEIPPQGED